MQPVSGWYHQPAELTLTARADAGEPTVEVRVGDGPWVAAGPEPLRLGDGVHTVTVRAVDRERHVVSQIRVEVNLAAPDDVSGVDSIRWKGPDTFWATSPRSSSSPPPTGRATRSRSGPSSCRPPTHHTRPPDGLCRR